MGESRFAALPRALSLDDVDALVKRICAGVTVGEGEELPLSVAAHLRASDQAANELGAAYRSLFTRVRLAELALYRAKCLADDQWTEAEKAERRPTLGIVPKGIANMTRSFVRDYVDVVLPGLREVLGYEDGDAEHGWYVEPEEARARLLGDVRARERLAREGVRGF